jgi:Rieske Fe-S protein
MILPRRRFIGSALGLTVIGCGVDAGDPPPDEAPCSEPTDGGVGYCLAQSSRVRVPGAVGLAAGEAMLLNVDDDLAVIVARDEGGLHALSGICTHACCVLSLCRDAGCSALTTTPAGCRATPVAVADPDREGALCPCHGSTFRIRDGVALTGPATTSLPAWQLTEDGDDAIVDTGVAVNPLDRA